MENAKYVILRGQWTDIAEELLKSLCENDPFITLKHWADGVKKSEYGLFYVVENTIVSACFLVRIDSSEKADELVIVAASSTKERDRSLGLYELITPYAIKLAHEAGCSYLRAHTNRKGVAKIMVSAGYKLDEYICRLAVPDE